MMGLQLAVSFGIWLAYGIWAALRIRSSRPLPLGPGGLAMVGCGGFTLSALFLVAGFYFAGKVLVHGATTFTAPAWVFVTGFGLIFVSIQAETAGFFFRVLGASDPRTQAVTTEPSHSSSSTDSDLPQ